MKMVKNKKKAPIKMAFGMENGHIGIKKVCVMRKVNSKMENYMVYIIGTMIAGKNLNRKNFRMAYVMAKAFNGMKMAGNKLRESM